MYLKALHDLENFSHLNSIAQNLCYKIKRLYSSTLPSTTTFLSFQRIPIYRWREECRLKCRPWKGQLSHTSFSRTWLIIKTSSADDRYEGFLSSVLHMLGFLTTYDTWLASWDGDCTRCIMAGTIPHPRLTNWFVWFPVSIFWKQCRFSITGFLITFTASVSKAKLPAVGWGQGIPSAMTSNASQTPYWTLQLNHRVA